jgi:hypothetical protein
MKKIALLYLTGIIFFIVACDIIDGSETKMVFFYINNGSKSSWEDVIVYAKDRDGILVDSSYQRGYLAGHRSVISIEIHKLKDVEAGIFEIQAKAENGKLIVQEFGSINKPRKEKEYKIELRDSTIVFCNRHPLSFSMKKIAILNLVSIIFLITSCDFLDRAETKMIYFDIENTSNNLWEDVVVFEQSVTPIYRIPNRIVGL